MGEQRPLGDATSVVARLAAVLEETMRIQVERRFCAVLCRTECTASDDISCSYSRRDNVW